MRSLRKLFWLAGIAAATAALLPAVASPARVATTRVTMAALESSVIDQLNRVRVEHDLPPLQVSVDLSRAASWHDAQMTANGYFGHDETTEPFVKRLEHYYPIAGYRFWSVAENLLWARSRVDGSSVVSSWMASPDHRANILDPTWREIGVSALSASDAPGVYGGHTVTVVTADFGIRKPG